MTFLTVRNIFLLAVGINFSTLHAQEQKLVWADEFDADTINTNNWGFDIGTGSSGWGNNELQFYTKRPENARIDSGKLVITAVKEVYGGRQYTSARLLTKNKAFWKYGRIEMRAKLPKGRGIWPAFWMLPQKQVYGTIYWPDNGEIDIMEYVGYEPSIIHGTVHTNKNNGGSSIGKTITYYGVENDFHVYAIEWEPEFIKFYVDDYYYGSYQRLGRDWHYWPFDKDFFILLNCAVGGNWGGAQGVDDSIFPQEFIVDYVRAYQKDDYNSIDGEIISDLISVSPNPVQDILTISSKGEYAKNSMVSVYNILGEQIIAPTQMISSEQTIDFSGLDAGIYYVRYQTNNEYQTIKIVKN